MKKTFTAVVAATFVAAPAFAEGTLNIYNWGNYTSPEMIEKFEKEYDIDVTITDYDSNDTALAKIKAGGHGYDIFDPPEELKGKINVVPEMNDVMGMAIHYVGGKTCTGDKDVLKKVRDVLVNAKKNWLSMDYGNIEKYAKGDLDAGVNWNGASMRARLQNKDIAFGYPKTGYPVWMDNAAILADAQNVENAKLFLDFIMVPENAAMLSKFARYANGISGSEEFMPEDMKSAPEIVVPAEVKDAAYIAETCPPEVSKIYTQIWTELQK